MTIAKIPSAEVTNIVGYNCLLVNIGENALTIAIMTGSNNDTIMHTMNLSEKSSGATPKNNTQYIKPKVNIRNPLVTYTKLRYFEASSIYGPSITSDLALI